MSAMSYHPRYRHGRLARAYWQFAADWQHDAGGLHRRGGQWYLTELASRFPFRAVRRILATCLPLAVRLQRKDGGFQADYPAGSACEVALAYARHGMLDSALRQLRHDPLPLIESLETPLSVRTRREALARPCHDDAGLARRLAQAIARDQARDGSWQGLILATAWGIHDLLDCGVSPRNRSVRKGCAWLLSHQRPPDPDLFPEVPPADLSGMFYTEHLAAETALGRSRHPEYRWEKKTPSCLALLPIYQTGAALGALCRCGRHDDPRVKKGFEALLRIRGPGGSYYTNHWCACGVARWIHAKAPRFGGKR